MNCKICGLFVQPRKIDLNARSLSRWSSNIWWDAFGGQVREHQIERSLNTNGEWEWERRLCEIELVKTENWMLARLGKFNEFYSLDLLRYLRLIWTRFIFKNAGIIVQQKFKLLSSSLYEQKKTWFNHCQYILQDNLEVRLIVWNRKRGGELFKRKCEFFQLTYLIGSFKKCRFYYSWFTHTTLHTKKLMPS